MRKVIAIPSSLTVDTRDEKIKTYKVGQVARAAAIFEVTDIIIYRDPQYDDSTFLKTVLEYAETPQYLRKYLFPRRRELRYAGVIPPLRTSHHPLKDEWREFREGVVVKVASDDRVWVDVGLDSPSLARGKAKVGERVTVRLRERGNLEGEIVEDAPVYRGYRVRVARDLDSALRLSQPPFIGTSRYGEVVTLEKLKSWNVKNGYTLIFGSPLGGIPKEEWKKFHEVVNFIPSQGTATVRTEEALLCSLSIMRLVEERNRGIDK